MDCKIEVLHSSNGTVEKTSKVLQHAHIQIREDLYASNGAIANTAYDVLISMPWHDCSTIDYPEKSVKLKGMYSNFQQGW